jgi:predicted DNA-binding ribbon-helix-helix protein
MRLSKSQPLKALQSQSLLLKLTTNANTQTSLQRSACSFWTTIASVLPSDRPPIDTLRTRRPADDARQQCARLDQGQESGRASGNEANRRMKLERRRKPPIKSFVVKQSVSIHGRHSSSVSLERAFWNALKEIAVAQNVTTAALVSKIGSEREAANLSSAIRVYVVEHYRLIANTALSEKDDE